MTIPKTTQNLLKACAKDEASYQKLVEHVQSMIDTAPHVEHYYNSLFEQSNDAVIILDLNGRHIVNNQRASDMLGYSRTEFMNMSFRDMVHPMEVHQSENILEHLLAGEKIAPYERIFKHKDGRAVPIEVNVELIHDEHGNPAYIQSILRDISDRKKVEQATRALLNDITALQEIHLELSAVEHLNDLYKRMIELCHEQLGMERVALLRLSEDATTLYGTYGTDIEGNIRDEFEYVEDVSDDHWTLPILNAPGHVQMWHDTELMDEYQPVGKGWKVATILWNGTRAIGYLVCDSFITGKAPRPYETELISLLGNTFGHLIERKETENALRASELYYRSVVTYMSEGVVIYATDGHIASCNPAAAEILGLTIEQLNERSAIDPRWHTIHEDGSLYPSETHPAMITLKTGQPIVGEVMGVQKLDGTLVWISISSLPMYDNDQDDHTSVLVTFTDITEIKLAQENKFKLALEQERMQLLTGFIQDTAHEFRTPLSTISTQAYLMSQSDDKQKRESRAEQINQHIDRMTKLVDMLLMMSKLQDQTQLDIAPIDLSQLLLMIHDTIRDRYDGTPSARFDVPPNLPRIIGDHKYLLSAFTQVLTNAYRYTPADGEIVITAGTDENIVWVEVHDTGMGIHPDNLEKIFDTFWRKDVAHSTPGLGLGLPIAKRIIDLHYGVIIVNSTQDKGTTVRISLPRPA